jgi:ABC-2 type transport system permease protein
MSPRRTFMTALRVLQQLHHDRRTVALILFVPSILMIILRFVFNDADRAFEAAAPMLLGIFPFTVMFIVTSIVTLRERTTGTLERLLTMPMGRADYIAGYALVFSLLALLQAAIGSAVMLGLLGVDIEGGLWALLAVAVTAGVTGQALGLFLSAFASTEFQAVQFMPAFVGPQILICGLFTARENMAEPLQWLANALPLPHIIDAMQEVMRESTWNIELTQALLITLAFAAGALTLGAFTLHRRH